MRPIQDARDRLVATATAFLAAYRPVVLPSSQRILTIPASLDQLVLSELAGVGARPYTHYALRTYETPTKHDT